LKPGDHIITGNDIYGGTYRLFNAVLKPMGFQFSFINMRELQAGFLGERFETDKLKRFEIHMNILT
jgi:O-acetylhomoserine/O-acetylserine sulfhydrylase-like pyridoxal-dependent enzyme